MTITRKRLALLSTGLGLLPTASVTGQDFPDAQRLTNNVLFAREDAARQRRAAERRRVDELDARARRQDVLLEQQAASVRQLGEEVREIRDERRLIDLAAAFDAAIAAGRWSAARLLLADTVTVQLPVVATGTADLAADELIAQLTAAGVQGGVPPRADQRVEVQGERATLLSSGLAWGRGGRGAAGVYDYGFRRGGDGWLIDRLVFASGAASR